MFVADYKQVLPNWGVTSVMKVSTGPKYKVLVSVTKLAVLVCSLLQTLCRLDRRIHHELATHSRARLAYWNNCC